MKTLFCYNKYFQGREELGPTSSWESLWRNSLSSFYQGRFIEFNPDAYGPISSIESDKALMALIQKESITTLVMINHKGLNWDREFISPKILMSLKSRGIYIVSIWGDLQFPSERKRQQELDSLINLNICTSSDAIVKRIRFSGSRIYTYVPLNELPLELESKCKCESQVSYGGSAKGSRLEYLKYLRSNDVGVHAGGGEGISSLSRSDYLKLLSHPITISFSNSRLEPCVNARTFEVLSQGTLLMEQWGRETAKFLIPFEHYVPWKSKSDLLRLVKHYLDNPSERERIAEAGHRRYQELIDIPVWTLVDNLVDSKELRDYSIAGNVNFNRMSISTKWLDTFLDRLSKRAYSDRIFVATYGIKSKVLPRLRRLRELAFPNPIVLLRHLYLKISSGGVSKS